MNYPHIIVFPGNFNQLQETVDVVLRTSDYKKAELTDVQRDWIYSQTRSGRISFRIGPVDSEKGKDLVEWKIFSVLEKTNNHVYLMPFHVARDIDNYFGEDVLELSKHTEQEIYYFWREHATVGYEKFQNGRVIKSIIEDTHGPRVEVDKQLVFESLGSGKLTIGTGQIDGKSIEVKEIKKETKMGTGISYTYNYSYPYKNVPQFFPPEVFDKVENLLNSHKGSWELSAGTENLILVWKGIASIDEYIKKKEKEGRLNKFKILIIPLILIAIIIIFAFLKR